MKTMHYTNTLRKTGEVIKEKVIVASEELGRELIANWNRQAESFNLFHYELVAFTPATKTDQWELGFFATFATFILAQKNQTPRHMQYNF